MDTLVGLGDDSVNTLEVGAFGGPITRRARSVLVASQDNQLLSSVLVLFGGIEDGHLFAGWHVHGSGSDLRHHLVDETDVGEGATSHNLIVASARTIRVEVLRSNISFSQVAGGWGIFCDLTSRGDVISRDRVTNIKQAVSTVDA